MSPPSAAHRELATGLLARERHGETSEERAAAVGRVYDKLYLCLSPLVGASGVRALFARSLHLTTPQFLYLAGVTVEQPESAANALRASLQGQRPDAILEGAAALFGAFLSLLATHIGERLTAQLLRGAWPDLGKPLSKESDR